MKLDTIKIYEKMTVRERAGEAFKYLGLQDSKEMDKIASTIPKYTYRLMDGKFRAKLDILFHTACHWAFLYWQNYSMVMSAMYLQEVGREIPRNSYYWRQRVIALQLALEHVSCSHGLDAETVYRMAQVTPESFDDDILDLLDKTGKGYLKEKEQELIDMIDEWSKPKN